MCEEIFGAYEKLKENNKLSKQDQRLKFSKMKDLMRKDGTARGKDFSKIICEALKNENINASHVTSMGTEKYNLIVNNINILVRYSKVDKRGNYNYLQVSERKNFDYILLVWHHLPNSPNETDSFEFSLISKNEFFNVIKPSTQHKDTHLKAKSMKKDVESIIEEHFGVYDFNTLTNLLRETV